MKTIQGTSSGLFKRPPMQADISSAHKKLPLFLFIPGTFCQQNLMLKPGREHYDLFLFFFSLQREHPRRVRNKNKNKTQVVSGNIQISNPAHLV